MGDLASVISVEKRRTAALKNDVRGVGVRGVEWVCAPVFVLG